MLRRFTGDEKEKDAKMGLLEVTSVATATLFEPRAKPGFDHGLKLGDFVIKTNPAAGCDRILPKSRLLTQNRGFRDK